MPNSSTHRDASNGGIDIPGKCYFDHFLTKHRCRSFKFLIENHISIETLFFSWDTERMVIIIKSVASKRFGWTKYQPIRMLYRDFSSKSVFLQGWSGSKSKQASKWIPQIIPKALQERCWRLLGPQVDSKKAFQRLSKITRASNRAKRLNHWFYHQRFYH